jgi:serine/threonine protein kinase
LDRDLKPENLLLDCSHQILKITDFGVATVVKGPTDTNPKKLRGIAGSDPYISPEQWNSEEYDAMSADIWSCGTSSRATFVHI